MKVGDYVRTEDGHIDKIIKISDKMKSGRTIKVQIGEIDNIGGYEDFTDWFSPGHFIKSSPNIIDLIEVGDYVNGELIIALRKDIKSEGSIHMNSKDNLIFTDYDIANNWYYGIDTENIKSIVTKEQFESMEYKVGE